MKRAIITISESGNVNIPSGNVWMSFSELVVLFDVAAPTLKATIRAIHKSGVIAEHTQHCEVMPYTYWATLYNMDMIVALAFRINSYGAEKIRTEVLKRICGREEKVCYLFSLANCSKAIS
ncbi:MULTISPECIES: hypothetical protein [Bacteroidales]|jgi:hypothetical protein|uniref:Virulence RhuM family protein n=2 Tax=Phocaeicola TaxID=909656 RepID=A0A6I0ZC23_PHOVU|nr:MULTISPECIES: hypothetical protein [Bacteroidales]KAB6450560.1 virulence RhuM family protein [Phocaeicola vulgatus]KAB6470075.1 virulence RhuM family protein [Phocaeicola vulgatus]MBT1288106.1 hypothetical protein [Phocaeicola dorei]MBT1291710.1 hypothetical protein [Phocaeicola dorei]MBU9065543.1 hypothetical protein [Phocaeicola vulgatus]